MSEICLRLVANVRRYVALAVGPGFYGASGAGGVFGERAPRPVKWKAHDDTASLNG